MAESNAWRATTQARLLEAKGRNKRLGHSKTRLGCTACKVRRIKCDQTYPECTRCLKTARHCPGYSSSIASVFGPARSLAPTLFTNLETHEKQGLEFFTYCVATHLGGCFDDEFWKHYVIQLAQSEEFVKDCVLAISNLCQHCPDIQKPTGRRYLQSAAEERTCPSTHLSHYHKMALRSYNRAVSIISERLKTGTFSSMLAVISCVLFSCISVLEQHVFGALDMLTQGARIMREYAFERQRHGEEHILSVLRHLLRRMASMAAVHGYVQPLRLYSAVPPGPGYNRFQHGQEARDALFEIISEINMLVWDAADKKSRDESSRNTTVAGMRHTDVFNMPVLCPSATPNRPGGLSNVRDVHKSIFSRQQYLEGKLRHWRAVFNELSELCAPAMRNGLLLYYHTSLILLNTHHTSDQMIYDEYTSHFQEILQHAEACLDVGPTKTCAFTFEPGPVAPLHMVATKCRLPVVRRTALQLLGKAPRKENVWNTRLVERLSTKIISIEENGSRSRSDDCFDSVLDEPDRNPNSSKPVPATSRIDYFEIVADGDDGFEINITRNKGLTKIAV